MPRISRMLKPDEPTVYHVISRTVLPGYPLDDSEKDHLIYLLNKFSKLFFVDLLGFCMMGNHIHLAVRVHPESAIADSQIRERLEAERGEDAFISNLDIDEGRKRLCSLSEFMRSFKQSFGRYFNKKHNRKGYFWGDRYKSLIVEEGHTLINLLAYIDLNPVRAGITKKPEAYRWSGLGYLIQTANRDGLIKMDFGLSEWNSIKPRDIIRLYRQFVYETGAIDTCNGQTMDLNIVEQERTKGFGMTRVDLFAHRCRYFTDSGIIGSREFVEKGFKIVQHVLKSKNERRFTRISGLSSIYSMKKLRLH